jgi:hypothetical protein
VLPMIASMTINDTGVTNQADVGVALVGGTPQVLIAATTAGSFGGIGNRLTVEPTDTVWTVNDTGSVHTASFELTSTQSILTAHSTQVGSVTATISATVIGGAEQVNLVAHSLATGAGVALTGTETGFDIISTDGAGKTAEIVLSATGGIGGVPVFNVATGNADFFVSDADISAVSNVAAGGSGSFTNKLSVTGNGTLTADARARREPFGTAGHLTTSGTSIALTIPFPIPVGGSLVSMLRLEARGLIKVISAGGGTGHNNVGDALSIKGHATWVNDSLHSVIYVLGGTSGGMSQDDLANSPSFLTWTPTNTLIAGAGSNSIIVTLFANSLVGTTLGGVTAELWVDVWYN